MIAENTGNKEATGYHVTACGLIPCKPAGFSRTFKMLQLRRRPLRGVLTLQRGGATPEIGPVKERYGWTQGLNESIVNPNTTYLGNYMVSL